MANAPAPAPAPNAAPAPQGAGLLDTPSGPLAGYTPPTVTPGESVQSQIDAAWAQFQGNPQMQQAIQQEYGDESWALSIPELGKIIVAGALYGWDQGEMDGAIAGTQWYKTASGSMRAWSALQATDPATANQQIENTKWAIWEISQQSGVALQPDQVQNLAVKALMFGWVSADATSGDVSAGNTLNQIIRNQYANPTSIGAGGTTQMGEAAQFTDAARQLSGQYLVPMSDQQIQDWTIRAVKGQVNQQGLEDSLRQQAAQLYPWMTAALNQGQTPRDFLSPYTQAAASTLSISPDQIDWTSPKWMSKLLAPAGPDGTSGGPLNVDQFSRAIKADPTFGYQNTKDAMTQSYGLADTILQQFGKVQR